MDPEMAKIFNASTAVSSKSDFFKNIYHVKFNHSQQGIVRQAAPVRQQATQN
jgi:hypothetical protein